MTERDKFIYTAELAYGAQRYDEMVEAMKSVVIKYGAELTVKERNLFSYAFKEAIGARRASWRNLSERSEDEVNAEWFKEYRDKVETEVNNMCTDVMALIDDHLIPATHTPEKIVFYYRIKGDFHRYLAEFRNGVEKEEAVHNSLKSYEKATNLAEAELARVDPVRLGVAQNFSFFCYQTLKSPQRACDVARRALDEATSELHTVKGESFGDISAIVRDLMDNLTLWTPQIPEDHGGDSS